MEISVTIQEKREFLRWFMQHFKIEAHDMHWFLQDLLDNEQTLEYVHFVKDLTDCPKGMLLNVAPNNDLTFLFFKGNVKTDDVYTAYHELQLYQHEKCYIQVDIPDCNNHPLFRAVLEADAVFQREIKRETEALLSNLLYEGELSILQQKINKSLEQEDYEAFMLYSNQLKDIKSKGNKSREMERGRFKKIY
jgi:uncharacterized protein YpiB (UPF0302 family)